MLQVFTASRTGRKKPRFTNQTWRLLHFIHSIDANVLFNNLNDYQEVVHAKNN